VGDSALIVGPHGRVVPPCDPKALAFAVAELLSLSHGARRRLGLAARRRIRELFDLDAVARRYESLYLRLAQGGPKSSGIPSEDRRRRIARCP
jgi:glycosyltransferase involved in cell wall biosynthesis